MELQDGERLQYIGHTASFYIPRSKLEKVQPICHEFFLKHYDAYTFEDSDIQGFWRQNPHSSIFEDRNVKYVVSFHGQDKLSAFVDFLSSLCSMIDEECIYLTMGYKSWLVWP